MRTSLAALATAQGGPVTWAQVRGHCTPEEIRHRVRTGEWIRPYLGVYLLGEPTLPALVRAALMVAGPGLVAGRTTAAALHGFGVLADDDVHLVGVRGTDAAVQPGLRVHAAAVAPADVVDVGGIPCTTPARTVVDLVRRLPRIDGLAVLDAALRAGATTDDLVAELDRHQRLSGVCRARELVPLGDPRAESPMESRLRMRIIDGRLPRPGVQVWVEDRYRFDLAWEEQRVAAEYDGAGHLDRAQQRWDAERRNWLITRGWTLLTFTDVDVYRRPDRLVLSIHSALTGALLRPAR